MYFTQLCSLKNTNKNLSLTYTMLRRWKKDCFMDFDSFFYSTSKAILAPASETWARRLAPTKRNKNSIPEIPTSTTGIKKIV